MFNEKFDLVFSIGGNCASAMFLNEAKLRMASAPFDWVVAPSLETQLGTLCARFDGFLRRENIVWQSPGRNDRASDIYRDRSSGYIFVHDFPKDTPLDDSFPGVREKYERRIARLLKRLDEGATACLAWWTMDKHPSDDLCREGIERVRAAFPNSDCRLLVFENDASFGAGAFEEVRLSDHCIKIRGMIAPDGSGVLGDKELNLRIFRSIRAGGRLASERRRLVLGRALARLLALWIPLRASRIRAREALEARFLRKGGFRKVGW